MKKIIIASVSLIIIFLTIYFIPFDKETEKLKQTRMTTHKLPKTKSKGVVPDLTIKKMNLGFKPIKSKTKNIARVLSQEEKKAIKQIIKNNQFGKLNEQLLKMMKSVDPENIALHDYIKNFPFEDMLAEKLALMDKENLLIIGELENNETSILLGEKNAEINERINAFQKDGTLPDYSDEKLALINDVTHSLSAHKAAQLIAGNMLETIVGYSVAKKNSKLNHAEVMSISKKQISKIMATQKQKIKDTVNISYSILNESQLREYSHFLQKINAAQATSISTQAMIPVFNKFARGLAAHLPTK